MSSSLNDLLAVRAGETPGLILRVAGHSWPAGTDFAVVRIDHDGRLIGVDEQPLPLPFDAYTPHVEGDVTEDALNPTGGAYGWVTESIGGGQIHGAWFRVDREAWVALICEYAGHGGADEDGREYATALGVTDDEWEAET